MVSGYGCVADEGLSGAAAESSSYNGEDGSPASPSPVYITITDPINGPSFQPSPTKPIPRWMRQLPNGREREQVHFPETASSAAAEPEVVELPIKDPKDVFVPSLQPSVPEEQKPPSRITHIPAVASAVPEAIMAYNDRSMTMSTPPRMQKQRPESGPSAATPLYIRGEMGVEYLKRYHLRALEERERGLQESKTGNIALERIRELGSVKQAVDRSKSMMIKEAEVWTEEEAEGERWEEKEMLRKELNGLFRRQG
ncbi:hypothetical protein V493_04406 [Pseudogymnoascus sp. VKM F-4281 (FW-2241)]|nr:hypothetical protein V493_04406 [Pseudogymnoascus sp. VKM F-4281 (FW-2241)]